MALEPYDDNKALVVVGERDNLPALRALAVGAAAIGTLAAGGIALGRALNKISAHRSAVRQEESRAVVAPEAYAVTRVTRVTRVNMVVVEEWVGRIGGR